MILFGKEGTFKMKYNIGDKVINKEYIEFLFNPFWKKDYRKMIIRTVKDANESLFTVDESIEYGCKCGSNEYVLHNQINGRQHYGNRIYLHLIEDHDEIVKLISDIGKENYKNNKAFIMDKINRANADKKELKETFEEDMKVAMDLINIDEIK